MSARQFNKFFCTCCRNPAKIFKQNNEVYPGQFSTSYVSDCCGAELVNAYDEHYKYGELLQSYEDQLSDEVEDE